jgi:inhibitor of KinA
VKIYSLAENAICFEWGNQIDENINDKVLAAYENVIENPFDGFVEAVPAYTTLTVFYDFIQIKKISGKEISFDFVKNLLLKRFENLRSIVKTSMREVVIPVCYDLEFGIDLNEIAETKKMNTEEIIHLHTEKKYRVFMIGFLPGFPYLGKLDEKISVPRKSTPRIKVEAGSVGIAGNQTGIYPFDSPGGWQIIGKTPLQVFDVSKNQPALFQTGDEVRFEQISRSEFDNLRLRNTKND